MSKLTMTAAGKQLTFRWDVRAQLEMEEAGYGLNAMLDALDGEAPTKPRAMLCAAMCNSGARHEGEDTKITADWIVENLTPRQMQTAARLSNLALMVGTRRELASDDDDEIIDVVLEELKKKKTENKDENGCAAVG